VIRTPNGTRESPTEKFELQKVKATNSGRGNFSINPAADTPEITKHTVVRASKKNRYWVVLNENHNWGRKGIDHNL